MARHRKTKRASGRRRVNAGRRVHHRRVTHRRRNAGGGQIGGMVKTAAGVVAGAAGSKILTQMLLGAKNQGVFGYLGNLGIGAALAWGSKVFFKDRAIATSVMIGTVAQVIVRAIGDYSPFGSYLAGTGVGDYMVANWGPNRAVNGLNSAMVESPWGNLGTGSAQVVQSNGFPGDAYGMGDGAQFKPC